DGVLADTEGLIARATIAMFRDLYGAELAPEDFRPFIGTGAVRYVEGPAEKLGVSIDIDAAIARRHEHYVALLEAGECVACPGALALVDGAAAAGWKLAIATSSPGAKAQATVDAIGLPLDRFTAFITGDMVVRKKPHPEIYEAAIAALGLPAKACVVVEDAVSGVAAAKAAGTKCLAVTGSFGRDALAGADLIVGSLEEVDAERLARLLS
ncbi:MAG: HAD-IA family hydrolase, partial [Candidatus Hydrogenedentes bacterium]|nr:HAD-IA family hydrolase [Candidatus Hydrogenedentota bacterium]